MNRAAKKKSFWLFFKKLTRSLLILMIVLLLSLVAGMSGYHYLESMSLVDSYLNAAMILSGMGPVNILQTTEGKLFAGTYALFSGILFLGAIAIIMSPVIHHFLHNIYLDDK